VLGEIDTLTLLAVVVDCAVQLADALTVLSICEVAVTLMLSIVPPIAFDGTLTLSVTVLSLLNAATTRDVGETLGDHPALSLSVKI
jgi:hypothetical protein